MKRLLCLLAALAVLLPRGQAAEPRCVALTFDDGPSGALTERLLDGLAARGVHATFFLCGYRIDLYPELAARIAAEGHETGTHGVFHFHEPRRGLPRPFRGPPQAHGGNGPRADAAAPAGRAV